jgi:hypothetical protein
MPLFRVVLCVLLLAVIALGQAGTGSSSAATPSFGSGQTGADQQQAPVNPLQEPPKTLEMQPKPKVSTFDLGNARGAAQDQQFGEVRLMSRYTQINGDSSLSFLRPGSNNLAEINYFLDRSFIGTRRMQVLMMARSTDDMSIDPEHNSLQKGYLRIYGPRDDYVIGDAFVNYSLLSFGQSVKGLSATWKLGSNWKLSVLSGIFIDRYGSLYKDLPGRPYMAFVSGVRLQRKLLRNSTVGVNFSISDDKVNSLPAEPWGTTPMPASNRVGSVDAKLETRKLRMQVETAYSLTNFDTRSDSGCEAPCDSRLPQPGLGMQGDWGARMEASYRLPKLTLRTSYVRYEPTFTSMNARQLADLQDIVFRPSYELRDWLTVEGTVRRSNDDLKGQLPFETRMWGPEGRFIFHNLSFYKRASIEAGYRHRMVNASDNSINHFVRMPYVELALPYKRTFFGVGYELRQAKDFVDPTQTSNTNHVYFSARGIYSLAGWRVLPNLRWELQRQGYHPALTQPIPVFALYYDTNRFNTAALSVAPPKYFIVELGYRESSATLYGPASFRRPSYRASATYKIANDENKTVLVFFERSNNFYLTSPNYDERVAGISFAYKFGKRGR